MYQLKCDGLPLLDLRDEELILVNPKALLEVNTVGSASFTIYKKHPYYSALKKLKSVFEIRDEIGAIFRGRMTEDSVDFYNGKAVDLEGSMAYFNDSLVRPFTFPDDFLENQEYITAAESGNVIEFFLKLLIDNHNSQVQEFQRFKLGVVTVSDPNNYLSRSETAYKKTWEILKSKLFESALGGFLCIRYEDDGNYIDYLSEFTLTNTQDIVFGENLLDLKHKNDASTVYSAIIPIGAEIEVEGETEGSENQKKKVTLADLPDGDITDDIVKKGDTLYSKSAVEKYGWIYAPVEETTWDDVTQAVNLQTKGTAFLQGTAILFSDTIETTAADQHFSDAEIQSFRIYRKQRVFSEPHNLSAVYNLTKLDIDLLQPPNTKITVGETKPTLTDIDGQQQAENIQRIEAAEKDIAENRTEVTEVRSQVITQTTHILNTCNEIVMGAVENCVLTENYESYKTEIESQFKLLKDELTLKFTQTSEQIANVDGDLQAKFNTITKYFTFEIDGLTIGQIDNPFKVIIDNDRYSMLVNNVEVLWLDPDGKSTIPELNVTKEFNLLGLLIDQDEEHINCEYIGGEE